jgi:hypothetical protein
MNLLFAAPAADTGVLPVLGNVLAPLVALTTVATGLIAVIAGVSLSTRISKRLTTLGALIETEEGHRRETLRGLHRSLTARLVADQVTPKFRLIWPFVAWLQLGTLWGAIASYIGEYLLNEPTPTFLGAATYAGGGDPVATTILVLLTLLAYPSVYASYSNTLLCRAQAAASYRAGESVRVPLRYNLFYDPIPGRSYLPDSNSASGKPATDASNRDYLPWAWWGLVVSVWATSAGLLGGSVIASYGAPDGGFETLGPLIGSATLLFSFATIGVLMGAVPHVQRHLQAHGDRGEYPARAIQ